MFYLVGNQKDCFSRVAPPVRDHVETSRNENYIGVN